ncbi:hypothetical protein C1645_813080, partial [Glomus cerebriforme]
YCYENGIGTKINRRRAFELYQKAADLGNARGIINLAYCYHRGIGTNVDKQKAFELFQKAANLEDADGLNYLGNYKPYVAGLAIQILNGLREKVVPGTPEEYAKFYTDCWNGEPDSRLTINEVVANLKRNYCKNNHENKHSIIK